MGLLSKVEYLKSSRAEQTSAPVHTDISKKKNNPEDFFIKESELDIGFDYPHKLFKLFADLFNLDKASLLVIDEGSDTYIPLSSQNLDITTLRHLRIEKLFFEEFFSNFNRVISSGSDSFNSLRKYLSIREFTVLESFLVIPFYEKSRLNSFLVVFEPCEEIIPLVREISLNSAVFAEKLIKARKPFSAEDELSPIKDVDTDPVNTLHDYIEEYSWDNYNLLIIRMDLNGITSFISGHIPETDEYQITGDILKSINALVTNSGKIVKVSASGYLIFFRLKKSITPGIIVHQLNLAVSSFFNINADFPGIDSGERLITDFTPSADTMLDGLM